MAANNQVDNGDNAMPTENITVVAAKGPKPGKKYFTLEEANRALAYVRPVIEDLCACYEQVVELRRRIEQCTQDEPLEMLEADYERAMDALSQFVDELHHVGVEIKDFEKGLVDFPAVHSDREVSLCWHMGETAIQAWHEVDAGFAGRQDVSTLDSPRKK
jgi:hypothetical protein